MSVVAKPLIDALQVTNAQVTQYTAPLNTRTIIDKFTATNTSAATATLTVNLVKLAGAASAANTVVSVKAVAPGECYTFPELVGHVLNAGDFISTIAGTTLVLTVRASGREVT